MTSSQKKTEKPEKDDTCVSDKCYVSDIKIHGSTTDFVEYISLHSGYFCNINKSNIELIKYPDKNIISQKYIMVDIEFPFNKPITFGIISEHSNGFTLKYFVECINKLYIYIYTNNSKILRGEPTISNPMFEEPPVSPHIGYGVDYTANKSFNELKFNTIRFNNDKCTYSLNVM